MQITGGLKTEHWEKVETFQYVSYLVKQEDAYGNAYTIPCFSDV